MRHASIKLAALILALVVTASACDDRITAVELDPGAAREGPQRSISTDSVVVNVLRRTSPLAEDLVASGVIGKSGGTIEIREAGLKVIFPRGAVGKDINITVTAHAGDLVAYSFEPHGITFAKTVTAEQMLQGTEASNKTDFSRDGRGYFSRREDVNWETKTATVTELQPVELLQSRTGNKLKFFMEHFSGYLVAIG